MIPETTISEIRERTDLVALVKEYVALKRVGSSFKGLCPFHSEKTPSFHVHPDRGFFHCFGCQASGDPISFLMRIEGLPFPEAARQLAERAGIEIEAMDSEAQRQATAARERRERLLAVTEAAAGFFVQMMDRHRFGPMALAELERRGITQATAERYRLGYAPHSWDELAKHLAERKYSTRDAEQVGLIAPRKKGDGHYDRFRHRLMFPVTDSSGRIVAFSGRALEPVEDDGRDPPAKYINSPESGIYTKGEILFGLHEARLELRRRDVALLCEGNFDVLALAQAGFANVCAPLGTAFTEKQAKLLRRYASTAVLLFDSDNAGKKAARTAQPLLAKAGIAGKVVTLPQGDDPDSYLRGRGAEAMGRLIDEAPSIIDWLIETGAAEAGRDPRARAEAIEALGPVLASLDNPVEARLYVDRVAHAFEVRDVQVVREQLRRGARAARGSRRRRGSQGQSAPQPQQAPQRRRPHPRYAQLELQVLGAFIDQPVLHESGFAEKIHGLLTHADLRAILAATTRWVGARGVNASELLAMDAIPEEGDDSPLRDWLERRLAVQEFEDEASAARFIERAVPKLERDRAARKNRRLKKEFLEAKRAGDDARADALMREMSESFKNARGGSAEPTAQES